LDFENSNFENSKLLPLSQGQVSIWLAQMLDENDPAFNIGECVEICAAVDKERFELALRRAVTEADALHLRVVGTIDGPRQYLREDDDWVMPFIDFASESDPRSAAEAWMRTDMSRTFDLARGPLFRFALLRISPDCFFWYAVNHHLVNDGFGWILLLRRVAELYGHLTDGSPYEPQQFATQDDLIEAERAYRESQHYTRDRDYWLKILKDRPKATTLSTQSATRKDVRQVTGWIPGDAEIEPLGRAYGSSAAAVMMAGVALYFYRMTGARDIVLGMQVSARLGSSSRRAVGMAANVIPLRLTVNPDEDFDALLRRTARAMREAFRHQLYRIEDLRRDLGISPQATDIFSVFANYMPLDESIEFSGHVIRRFPLGNWRVQDIQFVYYGGSNRTGYRIDVVANAAKYTVEQLDQHLHNLCTLISQCTAKPDTICGRANLVSSSERERILVGFNDARKDYAGDLLVHQLFEEQVRANPDTVAVSFENISLTYSELNVRSNKLAHRLRAEGVGPEVLVPVYLDQSIDMLVAVISVLKAGGAYVPIDPELAPEQIASLLQVIDPLVVLTAGRLRAQLLDVPHQVITLDQDLDDLAQFSGTDPDAKAMGLTPGNLAAVIFMPDLTGHPKGMLHEHRGVVDRLQWMQNQYHLSSDERVLQKTPLQLPTSLWELFWPLVAGARLVVAKSRGYLEPEYLAQLIRAHSITTVHFFPSALPSFLNSESIDSCRSLRRIFCSGEQLSPRLAWRCLDLLPDARLYELYQPTGGATEATHRECLADGLSTVPTGRPIANTQIYILDPLMQPVPVGATGEIYVGGTGIGRGYFRQPEFTAERFVPSPFDRAYPDRRLYKTGDFGRWHSDGAVELIGRRDLQIGLQGIWIDLNDIEQCLKGVERVKDVAVVLRENATFEPELLVYFTETDTDPASTGNRHPAMISGMQRALSHSLPVQCRPARYVPIAAMPLTAEGKLDRASLAARHPPEEDAVADLAPRGSTEIAVHAIWQEVLRLEHFGRLDNFFDLGGHSLLATQVASRLSRVFNLELPLRTIFEAQTLEDLARQIDKARGDAKQAIASTRSIGRASTDPDVDARDNSITRIAGPIVSSPEGPPTLSYSQQRMWLIQSLDPQNTAYNLSGAVRLFGDLDSEALSGALDEMRRRHENLRSTFREVNGEVRQRIDAWQPQKLVATDLRSLGDAALPEGLRMAKADAQTPIDLSRGPVFRTSLFRIAEKEHLLQLTVHHISGDQWSVGIISRELAAAYNALRAGRQVALEPVKLRYQDYATWQRRHQSHYDTQLTYWHEKLQGLPSLELPTDFVRPQVRGLNGASYLTSIDSSLLSKLARLSKREGCTLFMTMFAAFALQLHRLTGQEDFAIGVPIANRTHSDLENLVGTFVNTLALRVDLSGKPDFLTLLKRVRVTALDGYAHQDVSFDKLVQDISPARDNSRAPLVQVMFNMLNAPFHGVSFDGLEWQPAVVDRGGAQFELSLSVDAQISNNITFEYNTDLFEHRTIERFAAQYLCILGHIADDPTSSIASTPMLPDAERQLLLRHASANSTHGGNRPRFISMFEEQATRAPDAPAISCCGQTISYAALNARAGVVANNLVRLGIRPDDGVALCTARSIDLVVLLLGIQKAGAYYVPLDPSFPANRLAYMLADSRVRALITDAESRDRIAPTNDILHFDSCSLTIDAEAAGGDRPSSKPSQDSVAYIIYTSGSTGRPKGVVVGHRSLSNFLSSMSRRPGLKYNDVLAAVTTISFDIAGLELYLPLSVGACIELVPKTTASDAAALSRLLADSGATVMQATPATWRMLIDGGWKGGGSLRALCGGEALSRDLANALLARVDELWNLYGPTETTIWSTAAQIEPGEAPISIGRPIENTRVYIADRDGELCPIGVPGEILIAGDGVAMGYHGLPETTAERFLPDRFAGREGERVYRTGDLGKWNSDGELFHLGRIDSQVKVRGFRIEIGEIEFVLRQHPAVAEAVVVARELSAADCRLIAYVVYRDEDVTVSELRNHLRNHLPDYMVPALVVAIDSIPMTPNRKVDRKALPDPFTAQAGMASEQAAPDSAMEKLVADVWRELLHVRSIGADDNFFELGGHSLLAVRMVGIIKQRTGRALDPRTLYFKTLRQIAEFVDRETE
jgi:amino acid adenylation domain-containing protein